MLRRPGGPTRAVACSIALLALGVPGTARAVGFEVDAQTAAQFYDLSAPWGDLRLKRQRLTATLGLAAYSLQGEYRPFEPDYSVALRMRVDADFATRSGETDYATDPNQYLPGLQYPGVDLMYGYVEGRNLGDGWFGFRVGRQYVTDVLGWWSFDGALLRLTTPYYFQIEAYGGLEQRGGLPLSQSRFESQGVWRGGHGDLQGNDAVRYPSYQDVGQAPAFGFALESAGVSWLHGRFDYRRVYDTGAAITGQFPAPGGGGFQQLDGLRISQERLGWAGSVFIDDIGGLDGGFAYDVHNQSLSRAFGGLEVHATELATLGLEADYFLPTFDADSIWNWFTHHGITTATARVAVRPVDGLDLTLSGGARLWQTDGDPAGFGAAQCAAAGIAASQCFTGAGYDSTVQTAWRSESLRAGAIAPDLLTRLGARYRWGTGRVGLDASMERGFGDDASNRGRRLGARLDAEQEIVPEYLLLGGGVSVFDWDDPLRSTQNATSFGYTVAPEARPADFAKLRVEWEHEINPLVGHRFRVVGLAGIDLDITP